MNGELHKLFHNRKRFHNRHGHEPGKNKQAMTSKDLTLSPLFTVLVVSLLMAFLAASPSRRYSNKGREERVSHIILDLQLNLMKQEIKMTKKSWGIKDSKTAEKNYITDFDKQCRGKLS